MTDVAALPPRSNSESGIGRASIVTPWADLASTADDVDWVINGIVPVGAQVHLVGQTGVGKSLLALHLALAVCEGSTVLGRTATQGRVLWLDFENGRSRFRHRLEAYGFPLASTYLHDRFAYAEFPPLPSLETPAAAEQLRFEIDEHGPSLIVVDSIAKAFDGDENDSAQYRRFGRNFGADARRADIAVLMLDNLGKKPGAGARGSSAKKDDADLVWSLTGNGGDTFRLAIEKDRIGEADESLVLRRLDGPPLTWSAVSSDISPQAIAILTSYMTALDPGNGWVTPSSVKNAREMGIGGKQSTVAELVRWLKSKGEKAYEAAIAVTGIEGNGG